MRELSRKMRSTPCDVVIEAARNWESRMHFGPLRSSHFMGDGGGSRRLGGARMSGGGKAGRIIGTRMTTRCSITCASTTGCPAGATGGGGIALSRKGGRSDSSPSSPRGAAPVIETDSNKIGSRVTITLFASCTVRTGIPPDRHREALLNNR